jgi:hypothetical protein
MTHSDFAAQMEAEGYARLPVSPAFGERLADARAAWRGFFSSQAKYALPFDPELPAGYLAIGRGNREMKESFYIHDTRLPPWMAAATMPLIRELARLGACAARRIGSGAAQTLVRAPRNGCLRVMRYPAHVGEAESRRMRRLANAGVLRAPPHTDLNALTLLPPSTAPGLELHRPPGAWRPLEDEQDSIIVMAGRELQARSRGRFAPAIHRVRNPVEAEAALPRLAFAFFLS